MFLRCSYFFTKSEADVLMNSVLRQNTECMAEIIRNESYRAELEAWQGPHRGISTRQD